MELAPDLEAFVRVKGLAPEGATIEGTQLTGGVSSDIWKVETGGRTFVLKRALRQLRVAKEWLAPLSRNANEVGWLRVAGGIVPEAVPTILADDPDAGIFAMEFLEPDDHPVWKLELRDGRVDPAFAGRVGAIMAAIHSRTANDPAIASRFDTDATFNDLRLDPYLRNTGLAHPDLAPRLAALIDAALANKKALVHGDVSPKNILVGPQGPVILDAECAWYGDPAFDLAFCLNHLLLKCLWTPTAQSGFLAAFAALRSAYLAGVDWEDAAALEARTARLLPGLLLARVDGKSPVEYLPEPEKKETVRRAAIGLLQQGDDVTRLQAVRSAWEREIAR